MPFLFTHAWIANLVLKELSKRDFISHYNNIDDYFFGSIAPDIRYITNSSRDRTHKINEEYSIFEGLKRSSISMPFMAGYETHLVADDVWSNKYKLMDQSVFEYYNVNPDNPLQKFALYVLADDYFQGEAEWFFQFSVAGNVLRANDVKILMNNFKFSHKDILLYKSGAAAYLREPGIDTVNVFNFVPYNLDEANIRKIIEQQPALTSILRKFKELAIEKCVERLEQYL